MLGRVLADSAGTAATGAAPVIRATRSTLGRRFPSVGFTVGTSGLAYFEVVVAADRTLFDRSEARTDDNWFASGLIAAPAGRGRYVVPASALGRLLGGRPPAASLWYAAVAHRDASGSAASGMSSPASIGVVADFKPFTTASPAAAARGVARAMGLAAGAVPAAGGEDARAGEDGRDVQVPGPGSYPGPIPALDVPFAPVGDGRGGEDGLDVVRVAAPVRAARWAGSLAGDDRRGGEDGVDLAASQQPALAVPADPPPAPRAALLPPPDAPPPAYAPPTAATGPAAIAEPAPSSASSPVAINEPAPPVPMLSAAAGRAFGTDALPADYEDGWDDVAGPLLAGFSAGDGETAYPGPLADEWDDLLSDGRLGPLPAPLALDAEDPVATAPRPVAYPGVTLAPEQKRRLVELVAGGQDGAGYVAVNADGAFRGRFGPDHKAYRRYHTGLSFGIAAFNQDAGTLGQLLTLMRDRDPEAFDRILGPDAPALLAVATAPGPSSELSPEGRGPRVQPVGGADLWEGPWVERFRVAGRHAAFQAAQNQLCAELFLDPMLPLAAGFGLDTERGLAILLDRAISLGVDVARRWVSDTVGPVRTVAMRQQALASVGFSSVEEFQRSVPGLLADGEFGPLTHATMAAALRALGSAAPVPMPTTEQSLDALVDRSRAEPWGGRVAQLRADPSLRDTPLAP